MNNAHNTHSPSSQNQTLKAYDWSNGIVVSLFRKAFVFFQGKFSWYQHLADRFFAFCLIKPSFKISLLLFLFIVANPLTRNSPYGASVFIPLFSLLFFILCVNFFDKYISGSYNKTFLYLLLFFFLVKLIYLLAISPYIEFPDEKQAYDAEPWLKAQEILSGKDFGFDKEATLPQVAYVHVIAWIYFLFGKHAMMVKLFNLFLHLITGIILFLLGKEIFTERTGLFASFLFFISPVLTLWAITRLRESFFLFSVVLVFFSVYLLLKKFSVAPFALFLGSLWLVHNTRFYIGNAINVAFAVTFLCWFGYKTFKSPRFRLIGLLLLSLGLLGTLFLPQMTNSVAGTFRLPLEYIQNPIIFLQDVQYHRLLLANDNFAFHRDADISTPWKALQFLPIGVSFALFAPFPTHAVIAKSAAFFLIDSLLRYIVFFFACFGFFLTFQERRFRVFPLLCYMFMTLIFLALLEANIWTLLRHFASVQIFIFLFAAYAIDRFFPRSVLSASMEEARKQ